MTKISFYRINGNRQEGLRLACQLGEKAFRQNLSVLFHCDEATTADLSAMLWSFQPSAFLPHSIEQEPSDTIAITSADSPGNHHDVLISLTANTPKWYSRFEKAIEIVYDDQQIMTSKRDAFRYYKSRGYPLQYHDLSKT